MAGTPGRVRVLVNGQTVTWASLQNADGTAVPVFSDVALGTPVSLPATVSTDTTYYVDGGWTGRLAFAGTINGTAFPTEYATVAPNVIATFNPSITSFGLVTLQPTAGGGGSPTGAASGDLGSSYPGPQVVATHLSSALPVAQGGTGAATLPTGQLLKGAGTGAVAGADLTGDVTTAGGLASTIAAGAVSLAKMANAAANSLLGNNTGSPATPLALTVAQVKTLLAYAVGDLASVAGGAILGNSGTGSAAPAALSTAAAQSLLRNPGEWIGSDNGLLKAGTGDPFNTKVPVATLLTASTTYTAKVWLAPGTYTNYGVVCDTIGATLTATTFCFYLTNADATGTLVTNSVSADASAVWLTAGYQQIALGTPLVVTVGAYYFINVRIGAGTTMPKVASISHLAANAGCALSTNVAPNASNAPRFGNPTNNVSSGITPPATSGNIIDGGNTTPFWIGLT